MDFDEFLTLQRNRLLGYFLIESLFPKKGQIETLYPPSVLSDEELEKLMDHLCRSMPLNSIIMDLWDWDIHFEDDLGYDWLYETVFGDKDCLNNAAHELAEFFLEKVDEYALDYNQFQNDDKFEIWI